MNEFDERPMDEVVRRLRDERPQATDLELDRIKLTAMSRSARAGAADRTRRAARPRLVGLLVALGLLAGGTGALAASGATPFNSSSKSKSASHVEYCESENGDEQGENEQNGTNRHVFTGRVSRKNNTQQNGCDEGDQGENEQGENEQGGNGGNEQGGNGGNEFQSILSQILNQFQFHHHHHGGG